MRSRAGVVLVALAVGAAFVTAGCGRTQSDVTLTLDWTPNPDHVGFYDARETGLFARAGLNVAIRSPSDPTAPLKLVGVGKTDLAISYEPEVFFAAAKKLPVVAVAAVVPQPLNSLIAIDPKIRTVHDLSRRRIGITGVPSDYATLDTVLTSAGLRREDVKVVAVGYNLLPALLGHKVDAVLGVYRNVEGIQLQQRHLRPTIVPVNRAGVPNYDELVLVANSSRLRSDSAYRSMVRRFVAAFVTGTAQARRHPIRALQILRHVTASTAAFLARATPATLALLSGREGIGCMRVQDWQRFGTWMRAQSLLKQPIPATSVMTTRYLPARCTA